MYLMDLTDTHTVLSGSGMTSLSIISLTICSKHTWVGIHIMHMMDLAVTHTVLSGCCSPFSGVHFSASLWLTYECSL